VFNDESKKEYLNQKVWIDINFDPEKIEYLYQMRGKYDLVIVPVKSPDIRVEISIRKYRDLIRDLMKDNIESSVVAH
jgi:hypothetical protein